MFTGIVEKVATVTNAARLGSAMLLELDLGALAPQVRVGDSVLVDGVCLTATAGRAGRVDFDVSAETLRLTTLGGVRAGAGVNVELAMRPTDRFGGHFISGHVDGVGTVLAITPLPGETRLKVRAPEEAARMMVRKGSVAVDGVSLTIAALGDDAFEVSLIPHTLAATTLRAKKRGDQVNVECDMIGKWVRKFVASGPDDQAAPGLTLRKLEEQGF